MTSEELEDLFEKHEDEEGEFERIEHPLNERPDLAAFLRVAQLAPGASRIIGCADIDEVHLSPDLDEVLEAITEEDVIYLLRCGVTLDEESFYMSI